jgi:ureidoacrylate peracid hydrolase
MDLGNVALIIVDMQNDFLHEKGFWRKHSQGSSIPASSLDLLRKPIPHIKKIADLFRKNRKEVVYIYTAWEKDYSDVAIPLRRMADKAKEMGVLVRGSWGAQIIEELTPHESDHLVMKKAYGAFFQSSLDSVLRNLNIKTLIMTGIATNFCVETTSREAVAYGYNVILLSDATATYDPEGHQATLKVIAAGFGDVMSTEDVIKLLQQ